MTEDTRAIRERVSFRPAKMPDDEKFLQALYADTRDDLREMIADESQLNQLLLMQYMAQKSTYSAEFPNSVDQIVMLDDEPVGRLLLDHRKNSIHTVDVAFLRAARNRGIGTAVLSGLLEECSKRGVRFTLSVLKNNPAIRLYERLGCRIDGDNVTHFSMTWGPKQLSDL